MTLIKKIKNPFKTKKKKLLEKLNGLYQINSKITKLDYNATNQSLMAIEYMLAKGGWKKHYGLIELALEEKKNTGVINPLLRDRLLRTYHARN